MLFFGHDLKQIKIMPKDIISYYEWSKSTNEPLKPDDSQQLKFLKQLENG